jgi:hypothetical protein
MLGLKRKIRPSSFTVVESKNAGSNMWLILPLPDTNRSPGKEIPTKTDVPLVRASPYADSDCERLARSLPQSD